MTTIKCINNKCVWGWEFIWLQEWKEYKVIQETEKSFKIDTWRYSKDRFTILESKMNKKETKEQKVEDIQEPIEEWLSDEELDDLPF